jgi:hypothetical protein
MVVNAPTASCTAVLRRTVVSQLTVDKLNKQLPPRFGSTPDTSPTRMPGAHWSPRVTATDAASTR